MGPFCHFSITDLLKTSVTVVLESSAMGRRCINRPDAVPPATPPLKLSPSVYLIFSRASMLPVAKLIESSFRSRPHPKAAPIQRPNFRTVAALSTPSA